MSYDMKNLVFLMTMICAWSFSASGLSAETKAEDRNLCEKLETLVQDPRIGVHLESRTDGFVMRVQSRNPDSQESARSFAVQVLKEHDLKLDIPKTNGYGLPEQ